MKSKRGLESSFRQCVLPTAVAVAGALQAVPAAENAGEALEEHHLDSRTVLRRPHVRALSGNDASAGTREHPFPTIQRAADVMQAGDVCYIGSGRYRETVTVKTAGTATSPMRFDFYQTCAIRTKKHCLFAGKERLQT
jgi:hypothetical protein